MSKNIDDDDIAMLLSSICFWQRIAPATAMLTLRRSRLVYCIRSTFRTYRISCYPDNHSVLRTYHIAAGCCRLTINFTNKLHWLFSCTTCPWRTPMLSSCYTHHETKHQLAYFTRVLIFVNSIHQLFTDALSILSTMLICMFFFIIKLAFTS